jgi:hypothetical protein
MKKLFSRPAKHDPSQRIVPEWMPGVWVGAVRRAFGPLPEPVAAAGGDVVENQPNHWLLALWRPQRLDRPFLFRWPYVVSLHACEDQHAATLQMLTQLPRGERVWVVSDDVDWGLLAEIVMLTERQLQASHYRALQDFISAERRTTLARIAHHYGAHHEAVTGFAETQPVVG